MVLWDKHKHTKKQHTEKNPEAQRNAAFIKQQQQQQKLQNVKVLVERVYFIKY